MLSKHVKKHTQKKLTVNDGGKEKHLNVKRPLCHFVFFLSSYFYWFSTLPSPPQDI